MVSIFKVLGTGIPLARFSVPKFFFKVDIQLEDTTEIPANRFYQNYVIHFVFNSLLSSVKKGERERQESKWGKGEIFTFPF